MESAIVAEEKGKPVFDEQTLDKLLEAAFVLQEHSRELDDLRSQLGLNRHPSEPVDPVSTRSSEQEVQPETPAAQHIEPAISGGPAEIETVVPALENADYALMLERVAEVQHQIQFRHLDMDEALSLIVANVIDFCGSAGAAIAIVNGNTVCYRAVTGLRTLPVASVVAMEKALCFPCLRTAQVFRCPDVNPQFLVNVEECRRRGIGSLIAVPIFRNSRIAGSLELLYSDAHAYTERDVHTCQLMAGLITDSLAPDAESPETIPASLDPQVLLDRLQQEGRTLDSSNDSPDSVHCYKCGHQLVSEEQFCGQCGAARSTEHDPSSMQSKVASLWHMQQARKRDEPQEPSDGSTSGHVAFDDEPSPAMPAPEISRESGMSLHGDSLASADRESIPKQEPLTAESSSPVADWSSALSAREFLEQFAAGNRKGALARFWNARRGDIYLAVAVILVLCVIRWGVSSTPPVKPAPAPPTATAPPPKTQPAPQVSLLDRMLISVGLADAPEPPPSKGNPAAQVWIDLRTGLYYCSGADMYGKTPKGKYAPQRDAQLDQFEPAYRKTCD